MTQRLYIDNRDGRGERDFTPYLSAIDNYSHEKNRPVMLSLTVVPIGDLSDWVIPKSGATVRLQDTARWLARDPGARDGIVFNGFISDDPDPIGLGGQDPDTVQFAFQCNCTSQDYLISALKVVPAKTYINKSHGQIIVDLLQTMFVGAVLPYNIDRVRHGSVERIYQADPTKKLTAIIEEFAKSDAFTYYIRDGVLVYEPDSEVLPNSNDPTLKLRIDATDPRYTPDSLDLQPVSSSIVNDVTVFGNNEATTMVREHFVSDGYQGSFPLAFVPFGATERVVLSDDFTGDAIDTGLWTETDTPADFLQGFQGSLNIIGGLGHIGTGEVFLRAHKGVELSGILTTRDGELNFPPSPSGQGVIGGMYTTANATMDEADLFCGWRVFLDTATYGARKIIPWGPQGLELAAAFTLNTSHAYVLRRTFEVDKTTRSLNAYTSAANSFVTTFTADPATLANCWITWAIDDINSDDPTHVFTTTTTLLRKQYLDVTDFVTYAPIVSYNLHCILNFVSVLRPQQVVVLVNGAPVTVGSYLDGGRCTVTINNAEVTGSSAAANGTGAALGTAQLAWYAMPKPTQGMRSAADLAADLVTIPTQGSFVEVQYWQSDRASARLQSTASILSERQMFQDDGIRQQIVRPGDITPTPNTSEECEALAQAYLADRSVPHFEGTYKFETNATDDTRLVDWPMPGDIVPITLPLPDGTTLTLKQTISRVSATLIGGGAYGFTLSFGEFSRVDEAIRSLILTRESSIDEPAIVDVDLTTVLALSSTIFPADPAFNIISTTPTQFTIGMFGDLTNVAGYEIRQDDTGWGQPTYFDHFGITSVLGFPSYVFPHNQRDQSYFIRPYTISSVYSRRSVFVRVQHPMPNTMSITNIDGLIDPFNITFDIDLPINPDFAGVVLRQNDGSGTILYQGDGIISISQIAGVNVLAGTTTLTVTIPNTGAVRTYTVWAAPYDLLGSIGGGATFTITKNAPDISGLGQSATDPSVWNWNATGADFNNISQWNAAGGVEFWSVPGPITTWNVGSGGVYTHMDVSGSDGWGSDSDSGTYSGDTGIPPKPGITVGAVIDASNPNGTFFSVGWDLLYAGAGHINMDSADAMELQFSRDSLYSGDPTRPVRTVTLAPAANGGTQINAPLEAFFFRIRAHNSYGWSVYSNVTLATTGSALDALAPGGVYNFTSPSLEGNIKIGGVSGMTIVSAADGSTRAINGLDVGTGLVARNLKFGIGSNDAGGTGQTIVNRSNNVDAMANGSNVQTGGLRGLGALNGSNFLTTAMTFGALWFDGGGNARQGYLLGSNSLNDVSDGGGYVRTNTAQRDGGDRANSGLDGGGNLVTGLSSGFGVLAVAYVHDGSIRGLNAIDGGGARVSTDKVDNSSIRIYIIVIQNWTPYTVGIVSPSGTTGNEDTRYI